LLKLWFPGGLQELGQMQERLWQRFLGGLGPTVAERGESKDPR
jgi:hypothetical protein